MLCHVIPLDCLELARFVGRHRLFCLMLLLIAGDSLFGEEAKPRKVRLLTIGNSFANNATRYLSEIGSSTFPVEWMDGSVGS